MKPLALFSLTIFKAVVVGRYISRIVAFHCKQRVADRARAPQTRKPSKTKKAPDYNERISVG